MSASARDSYTNIINGSRTACNCHRYFVSSTRCHIWCCLWFSDILIPSHAWPSWVMHLANPWAEFWCAWRGCCYGQWCISLHKELQKCIVLLLSEFWSRLLPSKTNTISAGMETICTWLVRTMASQVLIFSTRHASLVRPLLESGKLRMAREHFGAPYQALWAFWPVIFLETSQLGASPLLQDLPPRAYFTFFSPKGQMSCSCPCKGTNLHHYSIHCGWILKGRIKSGEVSRLLWLICCKD